ncbi:hypothetical protein [Priestia aryabhattai]|uniref:hypothetical protein n=1 Tax=Priestia aryabhattai TaxID=412384 RepID=UPI000BF18E75|nr:hypothetical protein [Priestia aryabhattai]PEI55921.1 hypothetical protein CN635_16880 [Priestia aryabhattai]
MLSFLLLLLSFMHSFFSFISKNAQLLIEHLPSILKIIVPLSLTLYLFAYKERKDITYSYLRSKKMSSISLLFVSFSGFIILFLYLNYFLKFSSSLSDLILIVSFICWSYFLFKIYMEIFNSVNIFYVFNRHLTLMKVTNLNIKKLLDAQKESSDFFHKEGLHIERLNKKLWMFRDRLARIVLSHKLKSFDIYVQITSQILLSKIKYNLPKDFSENLMKLITELDSFIKITTRANLEHIISLNLLDQFCEVYDSILRNIELLTEYASKKGNNRDLEFLITFFNSSTVGPYEFTNTFYEAYIKTSRVDSKVFQSTLQATQYSYIQSVKSLTSILSNNGYWDEILLLRNIKHLSEEASSNTAGSFTNSEVLSLYTAFLIEATSKNDIKLLTDVVNLILENSNKDINSTIKMFLLCATKAIELGHYKCAGHLIKMTLLHSDDSLLKSTVNSIHDKLTLRKSFNGQEFLEFCTDLDKNLITNFMTSMPFSSVSFEYCFSKLVYMLSLQQKFTIKNPYPLLKYEEFGFSTSKEYIKDKVVDLHKEYGLICIKKEKIESIESPPTTSTIVIYT